VTSYPQFHDKCVTFVDILGFKSKVEAAEVGVGDRLSDLLEICAELECKSHVQSIAVYGPIICPESRHESRDLDYRVTQTSDCAIISTEISPAGIINLIEHISLSIISLLGFGVMVRGYVTRGSIFHKDEQFIGAGYQNALTEEKSVRTFCMSENDGATPFAEVDPKVVRYIREETDACVAAMFERMARVDSTHDVTVLFPFQQLTNVAGTNISFLFPFFGRGEFSRVLANKSLRLNTAACCYGVGSRLSVPFSLSFRCVHALCRVHGLPSEALRHEWHHGICAGD